MTGIAYKLIAPGDEPLFERVADDTFDNPIDPALLAEFIADKRHHMIVAVEDGTLIGMVSAVDYIHPDKPAQLWINEVGVAPAHRRGGIGSELVKRMVAHGRALGCTEIWLATEHDNERANALYRSLGAEAQAVNVYEFD